MSARERPGGETRYLFAPLERRGVLLGLRAGPLAGLVGGLVLAVGCLRVLPGALGAVVAITVCAGSLAAACWPVSGQPPLSWAPVVSSWLLRRRSPVRLDCEPIDGRSPALDHAAAPEGRGGRQPDAGRHPVRRRRPAPGTAPAGVRLSAAPGLPGQPELGVIEDRAARSWAAVVPVTGPSLSLLGPDEQILQLAGWGSVLAGLARDGSSIARLQWVERCRPADPERLLATADAAAGPEAVRSRYAAFVRTEAPCAVSHESLLVVGVRPRRMAIGRRGATATGQELLARELRLLLGQLRSADLSVQRALTPGELAAVLRSANALDQPAAGDHGERQMGVWPSATEERWASVRVDGTWQATYWVAEWPRVPVAADFLSPVLLGSPARTVAVTMAPVPNERAVREVQSARTAGLADEALRARAGFVATAQRQREAEGVRRREAELADGHAEFRYSGYVTVSGSDHSSLDAACAEVEHAARQAHMVLRRLYGRQAEARTWTLPLGRGLA